MARIWHNLVLWRIGCVKEATPAFRAWLVGAARGGGLSRSLWVLAAFSLAFALFVGQSVAGGMEVHRRMWMSPEPSAIEIFNDLKMWRWGSYTPAFVAAGAATVLELAFVRLVWLQLGARRALRRRECCPYCGHGLGGIPLHSLGRIVCPECARPTMASEAWNEIALDAQGRPTFCPAPDLVRVFWTPRRLRRAGALVAAFGAVWPIWIGARWAYAESVLRKQASLAAKDRVGSEAVGERSQAAALAASGSGPSALEIAIRVSNEYKFLAQAFRDSHAAEWEGLEGYGTDLASLNAPIGPTPLPFDERRLRYGRLLMKHLRDQGLFDLVDEIPLARPGSPSVYRAPDEEPESPPAYADLREVARICVARMALATDERNAPEFIAALRAGLAAGRAGFADSTLVGWMVGHAIHGVLLSSIAGAIPAFSTQEWLNAVEKELREFEPPGIAAAFEIEQGRGNDQLAWHFSDPARVRQGLEEPELKAAIGLRAAGVTRPRSSGGGAAAGPRLGTYTENRDAMHAFFQRLIARARIDPAARRTMTAIRPGTDGLALIDLWAGPLESLLSAADRGLLGRRAVRAMMALERYRIRNGEYPPTLHGLPEAAEGGVMIDPYSGRPFGYKRTDPATKPGGRSFILWTAGLDGEDNNGAMLRSMDKYSFLDTDPGFDYILNDAGW